jgi:ATP-binding cassette subfamily F protein 3
VAMVDIAACCAEVLVGLDEDTVEYIAGSCGEDGEVTIEEEDLTEMVAAMLIDAEVAADDESAGALVAKLWARLHGRDDSAAGAADVAEAARQERAKALEPKLLTKKVDLKKVAQAYDEAATKMSVQIDKTTINNEIDTTKADDADGEGGDPKAAANMAARCERLSAEVMKENDSLETEMAAAREAAALARTEGGGGHALGAIETGNFSLPNPGGGADLLESAAAVLVPGRRYGLIGRNGKGKSTLLKYLSARQAQHHPLTVP